jgi:hypothetical protein
MLSEAFSPRYCSEFGINITSGMLGINSQTNGRSVAGSRGKYRSSSMRDIEPVGVGEVGAERLNDFDGADGIKTNWFGVHMRELYHTLFEVSKWIEK